MGTSRPDVTAVLASLQVRWGAAAPRRLGEVVGSLATALRPDEPPDGYDTAVAPAPGAGTRPRPDDGRIVPTGFAALDAILGPGGLPRDAAVAVRGDGTSGRTTLALRLAAEAQASGAIVAYLDLAGTLDPVEAVARGVRLDWLVVLAPASVDEGLAMAGALIQARAVDLLLVDLPDALRSGTPTRDPERGGGSAVGADRSRGPTIADRLTRLGALARRAGTMLVVLEPPGLPASLRRALEGSTGLRLELIRRSWIRLGRDVVGQWTEVVVARSRLGPPGRRAELRILYADGGDRDACLGRADLLGPVGSAAPVTSGRGPSAGAVPAEGRPFSSIHPPEPPRIHDASSPSPLVPSPPPARPAAPRLRLVPGRSGRAGRRPVGRRAGPRHESGGARPGRPSRDAARERPSART